jgi:DHA1 family inner membrane transport protein
MVAPLLQTWLMGQAGPAAAGLAAAVNISVFGLAGAVGASLGGAVISGGAGLGMVGPIAAVPVLGALAVALLLRRSQQLNRALAT